MKFFSSLFIIALLSIAFVAAIPQGKQYNGYKPIAPNQIQHSGRLVTDNTTGKAFFYWLVESTNKAQLPADDIPLVVFFSGGPSCSSTMALLDEIGPYWISRENGAIVENPWSWTGFAHVMVIDMPAGVGFSIPGSSSTETHDMQVAEDMFNFFQEFMEIYPQYREKKIFFSGESFAGTWVAVVSWVIFKAQLEGRGKYPLNFRGFEIGNGLSDPTSQYPAYPHLAYNWCKVVLGFPCVNKTVYDTMEKNVPKCLEMIKVCNASSHHGQECINAEQFCNGALMDPYVASGRNFYDIRLTTQYNFGPLTNFMNQKEVQESLYGGFMPWQMCNMTSHTLFRDGWEIDRAHLVAEMLTTELSFKGGEKYHPRVMLIGGTDDFAVNAFGVKQWALNMKWPHQQKFTDAHDFPFYVNTLPAGTSRSISAYNNDASFTFNAIFNAGHMSPHDAPESVYKVMLAFIKNEKLFEYDLPQKPDY